MKIFKLLLFFISLNCILLAQDSMPNFELGPTLLTANSFNTQYSYAQTRPSIEVLNGLFFRYNKNRLSYRGLLSYVENRIEFKPPAGTADGISGSVSNKNLMLGAGVQHNLKKTKDWLYVFADVCYRNTFSTGINSGGIAGITYKYSNNSNALDSYFGLGFKIKIIKQLFISPELTYNLCFGKTITKNSYPLNTHKNVTYDFNLNSLIKVHLSVKF
jgi:hypothetical protein